MTEPTQSTPPRTPGQAEGVPPGQDQSDKEPAPGHPPDQAEGDLETVEESLRDEGK